jgi:hypothetical protein
MRSLKASRFVMKLVRCNMVTARSARLTNCSRCVLPVTKPSGVPPRRPGCGTCETGRQEKQNGGGVSGLSDFGSTYLLRGSILPADSGIIMTGLLLLMWPKEVSLWSQRFTVQGERFFHELTLALA